MAIGSASVPGERNSSRGACCCALPAAHDIILGVLGRAQRLYPLEIGGYVFASNHYHLLLRVEDAQQLARFMGYFNGNLAREVARLTGWEDKVWSRRYQAILVTEAPLLETPGAASSSRWRLLLLLGTSGAGGVVCYSPFQGGGRWPT